jgi:periplasmic divalent cation tolerance protein
VSGPILSIYRWEGKIEQAEEWRIMAKTTRKLYDKVEESIRKNHSYSVPQIIAVPVLNGFSDYLQWIKENTIADL